MYNLKKETKMTNPFDSLPSYAYLIIAAAILVIVVWIILAVNYTKKKKSAFLTSHPDAVRIYLQGTGKALLSSVAASDIITIQSLDGLVVDPNTATGVDLSSMSAAISGRKKSAEVFARMSDHLLTTPGPHVLTLIASHSRPGVTANMVATTYGPYDFHVNLEPYRSYQLGFDRTTREFSITERPAKD